MKSFEEDFLLFCSEQVPTFSDKGGNPSESWSYCPSSIGCTACIMHNEKSDTFGMNDAEQCPSEYTDVDKVNYLRVKYPEHFI